MGKILAEYEAERLLSKYIPVAKSVLTNNTIAAIAASRRIKLPLVLKLISKDALHKTELNGVRIVHDLDALRKEYADMMKSAKKKRLRVEGVLVQEFVKGEEVIIGIKKDPTFGHVIAFGIGGKYVEVIKDVSFRACPITPKDAGSMINELKYKKILYGARGVPLKISALKSALVSVSQLPQKFKNIEELDINPFIINEKGGKVADARMAFR